jgi:hypothetical protein
MISTVNERRSVVLVVMAVKVVEWRSGSFGSGAKYYGIDRQQNSLMDRYPLSCLYLSAMSGQADDRSCSMSSRADHRHRRAYRGVRVRPAVAISANAFLTATSGNFAASEGGLRIVRPALRHPALLLPRPKSDRHMQSSMSSPGLERLSDADPHSRVTRRIPRRPAIRLGLVESRAQVQST